MCVYRLRVSCVYVCVCAFVCVLCAPCGCCVPYMCVNRLCVYVYVRVLCALCMCVRVCVCVCRVIVPGACIPPVWPWRGQCVIRPRHSGPSCHSPHVHGVYVHVCVYICVYMCVHLCEHMFTSVCTCVCICVHVCTCVCMFCKCCSMWLVHAFDSHMNVFRLRCCSVTCTH